jgi:Ribbon-helix-helix protein, copG family
MIGFRAGKELTAKIDKWAEANETDRSDAMRRLIERGLEK